MTGDVAPLRLIHDILHTVDRAKLNLTVIHILSGNDVLGVDHIVTALLILNGDKTIHGGNPPNSFF